MIAHLIALLTHLTTLLTHLIEFLALLTKLLGFPTFILAHLKLYVVLLITLVVHITVPVMHLLDVLVVFSGTKKLKFVTKDKKFRLVSPQSRLIFQKGFAGANISCKSNGVRLGFYFSFSSFHLAKGKKNS